ncbi:MAG: A/G-specific adenine glycosylase [Nocardiopsaceae bacterium]|jgi:A/G-specific adenine glycosylase|nr:A/G-specific adenine glycosylase [Nocardiopsaceae bacterium]
MTNGFEAPLTSWYESSARDLPWRRPGAGAWPILVSEFMLQQTPVSRVLPAYEAWLGRWPTATSLAAATPGDALRQWGRLGYPRRALRLHACAEVITARHAGEVPASISELRALPGVGSYTAAAVASFAFGQRHAVLDTNVRRVLARLVSGQDLRPRSSASVAETRMAESLLPPAEAKRAATWSVALMELGALICTATTPTCGTCPLAGHCAWLRNGSPAAEKRRPAQRYEGTDRQCRGAVLAVLRSASGPVPVASLDACWPDAGQLSRVIGSLIEDGLASAHDGELIGLPGDLPELTAAAADPKAAK